MHKAILLRVYRVSILLTIFVANYALAATHIWLALGPASSDPSSVSLFETKLGISAWNGIPAAVDLQIQYDPDMLKIVNISFPSNSPFSPNSFVDTTSLSLGHVRIGCFQVTNTQRWDTLSTVVTINWSVISRADSVADININVKDAVEANRSPVEVFVFGQKIKFFAPVSVDQSGIPKTYKLGNNYPNPFNPTTNIPYQVPQTGHVSIKIYNVVGQMVAELVDEEKLAGFYTVQWDGKDRFGRTVSSGIYFYRMQAGSFTQSKKLALVR